MPFTPMALSASFTSSSLKWRTMASIFFMGLSSSKRARVAGR
jgi:hypothetical protein